jgi:hypothetical protein
MDPEQHSDFFLQKESFRNWVEGLVEEDCRFWDRWFLENPGQLPSAISAARILGGLPMIDDENVQKQVHQSWESVNKRIDSYEKKRSFFNRTLNRAAAVIVLFVTVLSGWYIFQPVTESYATGYSNRRSVVLSDGTEIMMNANTKIGV